MSTIAAGAGPVQATVPASMRVEPKKSVVSPAGTSAFEPLSIVGLAAVSSTSVALISAGGAQMLPAPGSAAPEAQASL